MGRILSELGWRPEALLAGDILAPSGGVWMSRGNAAALLGAYRLAVAALYTYNVTFFRISLGNSQLMYYSHFKTLLVTLYAYTAVAAMLGERFSSRDKSNRRRISANYAVTDGNLSMLLWVWLTALIAMSGFAATVANSFAWTLDDLPSIPTAEIANFALAHGIDWLLLVGDLLLSGAFVYMRHHVFGIIIGSVYVSYFAPIVFITGYAYYSYLMPTFTLSLIAVTALSYPSTGVIILFLVSLLTRGRARRRLGKN